VAIWRSGSTMVSVKLLYAKPCRPTQPSILMGSVNKDWLM